MLQFITHYPSATPLAEQVNMMVHAGVRWVELTAPGLTIDDMRQVAHDITPICRDTDTFVIMRQYPELASEFRFHGMLIDHAVNPAQLREEIGGEAVIGVTVTNLDNIMALKNHDIDYVVMAVGEDADDAISIVKEARSKGFDKPIVAEGELTIHAAKHLIDNGFSGLAMSKALLEAPHLAEHIHRLQSLK